MPSKRNEQLVLTVDSGLPLRANGSDMVTVIASITDKDGYVKRLSQETVIFWRWKEKESWSVEER